MANMRSLKSAAVVMFLAVALGAFGAHSLEDRLQAAGHVDTWNTAVLYQAVHGLALLGIGIWSLLDRQSFACPWLKAAAPLWLAGVLGFSGSLYTYSLGGPHGLVFITPIGGLCFLVGWAVFAVGAWRLGRKSGRTS